ncbi:anti-sigma factor [Marinomonas algarum]|uniref:Anti-sigma factor n=1 Tax=Marinomonas algarum TaxID=2883105 RepID=A0A9X1IKW0_9GAMM|nr:anti-sigma factor [Marinomonas algarum]MCB5160757.1 anti-sigma factor [Marinomonas algarum]
MKNATDKERQILAAEFVLGTLDKNERHAVKVQRKQDAKLNKAIIDWQNHFSELNQYVDERTPRPDLLDCILTKIDQQNANEKSPLSKSQTVNAMSQDQVIIDLQAMRAKLKRWQFAALSSSAVAACLLVFVVLPSSPEQTNAPFIATFQSDDSQPAFIMSLDIATRQLTVRPITAQGQVGKTYQLWIKSDDIGPSPRSLGLLGDATGQVQKQIDYASGTLRHATFGISLEPAGGSPTGLPTGPAIHGKLYPTSL